MRIELKSLEDTDGKFAHLYQPSELVLNDERLQLGESLAVSGKIGRSDGRLVVRGRLQTAARVECDRCLKPVELPVNTEFKLEYVNSQDYAASASAELTEKELALSVFDGEAIDLDELVREQLLLATPSRVLCGENCLGLCPRCGSDRNLVKCSCESTETDPRWAALKELVNGK